MKLGHPLSHMRSSLLLVATISTIGGIISVLPALVQQGYLHFHLYHTAFVLIAKAMNHWALGTTGMLLLLLLAVRGGLACNGRAGKVLRVVLPLAVILATGIGAVLYFPELHRTVLTYLRARPSLFLTSPVLPGIALLLLAGWLLILRRRRTTIATKAPPHRVWPPLLQRSLIVLGACFLLVWLATNLVAGVLSVSTKLTVSARPNIIFIMIDTLRADHVGCYGYDLPTTPNIDRFAREATRFEHAVSQAPYTLWSVTSMMSSRYPESLFPFEEVDQQYAPYPNLPSLCPPMLAEVLHDQGYATAAIISNPMLDASPLCAQGYDRYDDQLTRLPPEGVTSPAVTRKATELITALKDRPFFLSLVYMDPHQPYVRHPEFAFGDSAHDAPIRRMIGVKSAKEAAERREMLHAYDSEIGLTDQQVGRFLEALKQRQLFDDALIVLFSDHGEEFLEHGFYGHRWTVYEAAVQVPLIIKFPHQTQGTVVRGTFSLIDLVPSLLSYLGYNPTALQQDGEAVHLASLLRCADKPIFSATLTGIQSVRSGERKYIRTLDLSQSQPAGGARLKGQELYHVMADPLEQHNRMATTATDVASLTALLQTHDLALFSRKLPVFSLPWIHVPDAHTLSEQELHDRLKSLGYLNPGVPSTVTAPKAETAP